MIKKKYSPYEFFSVEHWAKFQHDTPLTLTEEKIKSLRSVDDPVDVNEVKRVYLSLSRLLCAHAGANQSLFKKRCQFLKRKRAIKVPYIIAIAGSVAVGKSTTARVLKELLQEWPENPKVDLVTTDGFLYPNTVLERRNILGRKGFPESYNIGALIRFLSDLKSGKRKIQAPVYSHLIYDVEPNAFIFLDRPDILILEGVNVLQPPHGISKEKIMTFLSDFFDFTLYIDADEHLIHDWYINRFMKLRETAFRDHRSFFHRYSQISTEKAYAIAEDIWQKNNLKNLRENIFPTQSRADVILRKGKNHLVQEVGLRKL